MALTLRGFAATAAITLGSVLAVVGVSALTGCSATPPARSEGAAAGPQYAVDASWPKPLPKNWILGQVSGIAVDKNDTVWFSENWGHAFP